MKKLLYTTNPEGSEFKYTESLYFDNELKDGPENSTKTTVEELTQGIDNDIEVYLDGVKLSMGEVQASAAALAQKADAETADTERNFVNPNTLPN